MCETMVKPSHTFLKRKIQKISSMEGFQSQSMTMMVDFFKKWLRRASSIFNLPYESDDQALHSPCRSVKYFKIEATMASQDYLNSNSAGWKVSKNGTTEANHRHPHFLVHYFSF